MQYALIKNKKVENVIVADQAFIALISAEWDHIEPLETLDEQWLGVGIGWTYIDRQFQPPQSLSPQLPEVEVKKHIQVGSFFDRFGSAKWAILADTNPMVQALVKDSQVRKFINLDDPQLQQGLNLLVSQGHAIDVQQILNTPIQEQEKA